MTNQENAYAQIEQPVRHFKALSAAERNKMNENATRQGTILLLFRALGWNVDNVSEVSPEEKVSRGWVDFSFRIISHWRTGSGSDWHQDDPGGRNHRQQTGRRQIS